MSKRDLKENECVIQLGKTGIVYEDISEIKNSIFQKVYGRAFGLTKQIIHNQSIGTERSENEQIDNIITFVGRRGTGKTSAMLSFMEFLKKNIKEYDGHGTFEEKYKITNYKQRRIHFIALEWIDASLLEKGEDIFEYILAKLLREVLDLDDKMRESGYQSYEIRELHQAFSSIYKKVLNLKNREKGQIDSDMMPISLLRDLARSTDLRREFEELIQRYIQLKLSKENSLGKVQSAEDTYLVVAIDDMDMNVESGFEILEKIQRYLKIKGLIVLIAINHEQMHVCCEKHFSKMYNAIPQNDIDLRSKSISKIAEEYMEKALPSYMRVYLPSMKKKDYDRDRLTQVEIKINDSDNCQSMSIKEAIFRIYEQKTLVRFDSAGKKRHFMEPSTLRQLNNQYLFLENMETVGENLKEDFEVLNQNIKRCMDDILFRFASENLPQKEREYFLDFSEMDLRRRGRNIVSFFLEEVKKSDLQSLYCVNEENKKYQFIEEYEVYGYSYGELMRCLFFLGREPNICDKKLIHAILAMYTLTLTKIFSRYKEGTEEEKKKNYNMLKQILGESAAGSWALFFSPFFEIGYTGAVKRVSFEKLTLKITSGIKNQIKKVKSSRSNLSEKVCQVVDSMTNQIIMRLFFSNLIYPSSKEATYEFKVKEPYTVRERYNAEQDEAGKNYEIAFSNIRSADFSVMNFVNNIFIFDEIMDEFIRAVVRIKLARKSEIEKEDEVIDEVKSKMLERESSFYCDMKKWKDISGGAVVPFYSTDIYYNMLKRLERERDIVRESENHFEQLQNLLQKIGSHLKKADDFYFKENPFAAENTKTHIEFVKVFEGCPVIEEIKKSGNDELKEMYNEMVGAVIGSDNDNERLWKYSKGVLNLLI